MSSAFAHEPSLGDAQQSAPPERISFLVTFGADKCPEAVGDEIVVCAAQPESECSKFVSGCTPVRGTNVHIEGEDRRDTGDDTGLYMGASTFGDCTGSASSPRHRQRPSGRMGRRRRVI